MSQSSCMLYLTHAYFKIKLSVGHKNVVKENKVRKQRKKEIHAAPLLLLSLSL